MFIHGHWVQVKTKNDIKSIIKIQLVLTIFFISIQLSYKISLVKTLVDTLHKLGNTWKSFFLDLKHIMFIYGKNQFPVYLIDKIVKSYSQGDLEAKQWLTCFIGH